jgi:hypothetical protein
MKGPTKGTNEQRKEDWNKERNTKKEDRKE